jgi:UDP-2,3-diacylglucosamine hydrolase
LVALFVSDIHLSPALPKTTSAFLAFLKQKQRKQNNSIFLAICLNTGSAMMTLQMTTIKRSCLLEVLTKSGVELFWIAGNRDF